MSATNPELWLDPYERELRSETLTRIEADCQRQAKDQEAVWEEARQGGPHPFVASEIKLYKTPAEQARVLSLVSKKMGGTR